MKNKLKWIILVLIWVFICFGIIYSIDKEKHSCSRVIFIEGELSRDINSIDYVNHGNIARIYYCDGKVEDIPTSKIIKVVFK
jgi:hypothetical protein